MNSHPWRAQRGPSFLLVLVFAKIAASWQLSLPHSPWLPIAMFWDDVLVAAAFWCMDNVLGRPRWMWAVYGALVAWIAINVPITWALSSPLTWPMLRAARGALADSIGAKLTAGNVAAICAVGMLSAVLPPVLAWTNRPVRVGLVGVVLVIAALSRIESFRVDLNGHERNAVTALMTTWRPRIQPVAAEAEWRVSPFRRSAVTATPDLTPLRGAAAGMNVVLVALESTGARYLRSYGASDDPMPHLTELAARALQFDRAYAVYPESIKGLFATLCSRAPALDVAVDVVARVPCTPLASLLSSRGYRTALFHSGRFGYLGMQAVVDRQQYEFTADAAAIGGKVESSFGVDEYSTVSKMLEWIDGTGHRPFFLTYLPIAGHHPYATAKPGPFAGDDELTAYRNALHEADAALGVLLSGLSARSLAGNTLVVAYGDHGEAFGQHGGNFGHTMFIYDENVRVPLLFAVPGSAAVRVSSVASTIDVTPTVVDLLGIPPVGAHEGTSLLDASPRLALFYTDYSLPLVGLQDDCWKFIHQIDHGSRLFDTCGDPDELHDLAAEQPARVEAYRQRVRSWAAARRAAFSDF